MERNPGPDGYAPHCDCFADSLASARSAFPERGCRFRGVQKFDFN
jgi:hypothetical protein